MIEFVTISLFFLLTINYTYFLFKTYKGLDNIKLTDSLNNSNKLKTVSVIVPFRNESENILLSFNSLQNQTYPKNYYEVIFVNDNSTDDSFQKLINAKKDNSIKVLSVPNDYLQNAHKKRAVKFGIENSNGEIIISTDADCIHNEKWLETFVQYFDDNTGFVSGPVFFHNTNSFFEKIQQIEFAGLIIVGAGLIGNNTPKICNAANCGYSRKAFLEVNGFDDSMHLSSGDDELLMQKISKDTIYNIKFASDLNCIVYTNPNKNITEFLRQRKRWASKGFFYSDNKFILKLIAIYLYFLFLALLFVIGLFSNFIIFISFLVSFMIKIMFEYILIQKGMKLFSIPFKKVYFLMGELFHIPYILISGLSGSTGNFTWKERKVKR